MRLPTPLSFLTPRPPRGHRSPRLIAGAALASLLVLPALANGQNAPRELRGYQLEHIESARVATILRSLLKPQITVDIPRSPDRDDLIQASGSAVDLAQLEELIRIIDVPQKQDRSALNLEFYELGDMMPEDLDLADDMIRSMIDPLLGERYSVSVGGIASLFGSPATHERVRRGIEQLRVAINAREARFEADEAGDDDETSSAVPSDSLLRLTWLATSPDDDEGIGRAVGADMSAVVRQLEGLGMTGWRELGRTSVMTSRLQSFSVETVFSPANSGQWQLRWNGMTMPSDDDRTSLETRIALRDVSSGASIDLGSTLKLDSDRRMVLGLTPILEMHSVLVIELVNVRSE